MIRDGYDFYENSVLNGVFKRLVIVASKGADADLQSAAADVMLSVNLPKSLLKHPKVGIKNTNEMKYNSGSSNSNSGGSAKRSGNISVAEQQELDIMNDLEHLTSI